MANPKRRHSRARRDKRRANWRLTPSNFKSCPQCGGFVLPHRVCLKCGSYNGKIVLTIKQKNSTHHQEVVTSE